MILTPEEAGRLHAILTEALSIMDSVPFVPSEPDQDPEPEPDPDAPKVNAGKRVRKPGTKAYELDAEVYDRLLATPAPQSARGIAEEIHESIPDVARSLRRLQASGRAKMVGSKRGARYLPLSITGQVVSQAAPCEPDVDDVF